MLGLILSQGRRHAPAQRFGYRDAGRLSECAPGARAGRSVLLSRSNPWCSMMTLPHQRLSQEGDGKGVLLLRRMWVCALVLLFCLRLCRAPRKIRSTKSMWSRPAATDDSGNRAQRRRSASRDRADFAQDSSGIVHAHECGYGAGPGHRHRSVEPPGHGSRKRRLSDLREQRRSRTSLALPAKTPRFRSGSSSTSPDP